MKTWIEIREKVVRVGDRVILVESSMEHMFTGFRSVYEFDELTMNYIEQKRNTKGLKGWAVYSKKLYVDFDDAIKPAQMFRNYLKNNGLSYELYASGNRSFHFHVDIVPCFGSEVPALQRCWIEKYGKGADTSIYRHCGIYRLPGTIHEKTGREKKLLEKSEGEVLDIGKEKLLEEKEKQKTPLPPIEEDVKEKGKYYYCLFNKCKPGHRRPTMFKIVACGIDGGKTIEEIEKDVDTWNRLNCNPPLEDYELQPYFKKTCSYIIGKRNNAKKKEDV